MVNDDNTGVKRDEKRTIGEKGQKAREERTSVCVCGRRGEEAWKGGCFLPDCCPLKS